MTQVITVTNQKGGVGKTTTVSALVCGLKQRGARVLGVDLDPQGNLGFTLGLDIGEGNRNVITGLASGMDTESMIENAISAYKNKISALSQKRTKTEWKQDAYRSMISKMSSFLSKYTSYRSANNLMSTSFFDQAVKTVSKGLCRCRFWFRWRRSGPPAAC